jgi:tRNA(Ile)-lysidine synthase
MLRRRCGNGYLMSVKILTVLEPITAKEFLAVLPVTLGDKVAVGVSGGSDSMALALLLNQVRPGAVQAVIVDHRLRSQSNKEATLAQRWLGQRGVAATVVTVFVKNKGNTLEQARIARGQALRKYCYEAGINQLFLAHHQDDQAETVWLRLCRGTGVSGLAAMRPQCVEDGITVVRPLLGVEKARLEATCMAFGQAWISEPSNFGDTQRAAMRVLPDTLLPSTSRLAGLAQSASAVEDVMADVVTKAKAAAFESLNPEVQRRLLLDKLRHHAPRYRPRARAIAEMQRRLQQGKSGELAGVRFTLEG